MAAVPQQLLETVARTWALGATTMPLAQVMLEGRTLLLFVKKIRLAAPFLCDLIGVIPHFPSCAVC